MVHNNICSVFTFSQVSQTHKVYQVFHLNTHSISFTFLLLVEINFREMCTKAGGNYTEMAVPSLM